MNIHYAQLLHVFADDGIVMGRIRVKGALRNVPLTLVVDARPGDTLLVCDGVPISATRDTNNMEDT